MNACKRLIAVTLLAVALALGAADGQAQTRSFIWKATRGPGTVYLLGSVHVLTKDYYPLSPALEAAYKDSALLVEEVDMGEMLGPDAQMQMLSHGMLPSGQTLNAVITPATRALVDKAVTELGVP